MPRSGRRRAKLNVLARPTRAMENEDIDQLLNDWVVDPPASAGLAGIQHKAEEIATLCRQVQKALGLEPGSLAWAGTPERSLGEAVKALASSGWTEGDLIRRVQVVYEVPDYLGSDDSDSEERGESSEGESGECEPSEELACYMLGKAAPGLVALTGLGGGDLLTEISRICGGEYPGWKVERVLTALDRVWAQPEGNWLGELAAIAAFEASGVPGFLENRAAEVVFAAVAATAAQVGSPGSPPEGAADSEEDDGSRSWLEDPGPAASDDETDEEQAEREGLTGDLEALQCQADEALAVLEDSFIEAPWLAHEAAAAVGRVRGSTAETTWLAVVGENLDPCPLAEVSLEEIRERISATTELLSKLETEIEPLEEALDEARRKRDRLWCYEGLLDEPSGKRRRVDEPSVADRFDALMKRARADDEDELPLPEDSEEAMVLAEELVLENLDAAGVPSGREILRDWKRVWEIRDEQQRTDLAIPALEFATLCDELLQFIDGPDDLAFDQGAYAALHAAAEDHITRVFTRAGTLAVHTGRTRLWPKDLRAAVKAEPS